jgi:hypothetical protein
MKRIIFIVDNKLNNFDYQRFGINFFEYKKFKIIILNIAPFTRSEYFLNYKVRNQKEKYQIYLKNIKEINFQMNKILSTDIVLCNFSINHLNYFIIKFLDRKKLFYIYLDHGILPLKKIKILKKILIFFRYPIKSIKFIIKKIFLNNNNFISPSVYLYSSSKIDYKVKYKLKTRISDLDYDRFLLYRRNKKSHKLYKKKYALYLETPFNHSDGWFDKDRFPPEVPCSLENYYNTLNSFLKIFSTITKLDIKVLCHPRSNFINHPIKIGKIYNNSSDLSLFEKSEIILLHASTSIKLATIFNKPLIFLTQNHFTPHNKKNINDLAYFFKKEPINMSLNNFSIDDYRKNLAIQKNIYKLFLHNYVINYRNFNKTSYEILYELLILSRIIKD